MIGAWSNIKGLAIYNIINNLTEIFNSRCSRILSIKQNWEIEFRSFII